jgi:hypothetical protein
MLVALLQRDQWGSTINSVIFAAAVVVAAVIYQFAKVGHWNWNQWSQNLYAIIAWSLATYHAYWNRSPLIAKARAIPPPPQGPTPPAA